MALNDLGRERSVAHSFQCGPTDEATEKGCENRDLIERPEEIIADGGVLNEGNPIAEMQTVCDYEECKNSGASLGVNEGSTNPLENMTPNDGISNNKDSRGKGITQASEDVEESSESEKPRYNWRGKIVVNSKAGKKNKKGAGKSMNAKGGLCRLEGGTTILKAQHRKVDSPLADSISSSPTMIENKFLCFRNTKREAIQFWYIGKELGVNK